MNFDEFSDEYLDEHSHDNQAASFPRPPPIPQAPKNHREIQGKISEKSFANRDPLIPSEEGDRKPPMPEIPEPQKPPMPEIPGQDSKLEDDQKAAQQEARIAILEEQISNLQFSQFSENATPVAQQNPIGELNDGEQLPGMPFDNYVMDAFPFGKVINGYTISGANITIIEPEIQVGDATPISISSTAITITADYQYVGVKFTWATWALSAWGPEASKPSSDETAFRRWLYQLRFDEATGKITGVHRYNGLGGIAIPAVYGDES